MSKFWKINLIINLTLIMIYVINIVIIYHGNYVTPFFVSLPILLPYFTFTILIIQISSLLIRFLIKKNNKYGWICIFWSVIILFLQLIILILGTGSLG
ncbi:Hypothetical transmembrane protein [Flavobacterium branchiophilum]|uniref:Hypothetical transmembrane protein n=1 Tax=Flavobacterium branchiophilum (strain FL-15) TaxID=1034807 RepID=G2Z5K7_FLABF|nr:Hypothetical transmembrane protein [Flavobacterium branchiophilum FL-15]